MAAPRTAVSILAGANLHDHGHPPSTMRPVSSRVPIRRYLRMPVPRPLPMGQRDFSRPPDESGQTLNFTVSNDNNALFSVQPAVSPAGVLTYTAAAEANGSALVTLSLVDTGGTANGGVDTSVAQTFTINVTPINDAPSFTAGPDQTVLEDAGAQTVNRGQRRFRRDQPMNPGRSSRSTSPAIRMPRCSVRPERSSTVCSATRRRQRQWLGDHHPGRHGRWRHRQWRH